MDTVKNKMLRKEMLLFKKRSNWMCILYLLVKKVSEEMIILKNGDRIRE